MFQCIRGDTFNVVVVDEANFIRSSIYNEILPMISTDLGKLILVSSHRNHSAETSNFVDIDSLRGNDILVNNVVHVCSAHIASLLKEKIPLSFCICYMFSQAPHISMNQTYSRIVSAFANRNSNNSEITDEEASDKLETNHFSSLMSEMGIVHSGLHPLTAGQNINVNDMRLASLAGRQHLISKQINVHRYLTCDSKLQFNRTIVVYIDPAPTEHTFRSLNAMTFVTYAYETKNEDISDTQHHYVVLAIEEFHATQYEQRPGFSMQTLAKVFLQTCDVLYRLYEGYFNHVLLAPEANTINLEGDFWDECRRLYRAKYNSFHENLTIESTLIEYNPFGKKSPAIDGDDDDALIPRQKRQKSSNEVRIEKQKYKKQKQENMKRYRIGYMLQSEKVNRLYNFFTSCYNFRPGNIADLTCAEYMWSTTIVDTNDLAEYLADAMDVLRLKRKNNRHGISTNSINQYTISGKREMKKSFIQDDLAICTAFSTLLCEDYVHERLLCKLERLQ